MSSITALGFASNPHQSLPVETPAFTDYLSIMANQALHRYREPEYIHTRGSKRGQTLANHILDLVTFASRLAGIARLNDDEARSICLALTIHDINKLHAYGQNASGFSKRYADAATPENIVQELTHLGADAYFPAWRDYVVDITYLAHAHQDSATSASTVIDQRVIDTARFGQRLTTLAWVMKAADAADNAHTSDPFAVTEVRLRGRVLEHINNLAARTQRSQWRFCGHRLAEQRGVFTNIIHNECVNLLQERYGKDQIIDVQYFADGVNYLLDMSCSFSWTATDVAALAERVRQRVAELQFSRLGQFIKATPSGISVDKAAFESGASLAEILETIVLTVQRKSYKSEWLQERSVSVRNDLAQFSPPASLQEHYDTLLAEPLVLSSDEDTLRRGELVAAYRKLLEDYYSHELKQRKETAWSHCYRLFQLNPQHDPCYEAINSYRRGYFIARDLPLLSLEQMSELLLKDLAILRPELVIEHDDNASSTPLADATYLVDYLNRTLQVWEGSQELSTGTRDFADTLVRYAATKGHRQCCACGSALAATEWNAMQVPPSIAVQMFTNRLEGGSTRDPKRLVCAVCRMQYTLEKLIWRGHRDKYGKDQSTFFLHLYPFAYFTAPLLEGWFAAVQRLGDSENRAFFIDARSSFRALAQHESHYVLGHAVKTNGLGIPLAPETIGAVPVLGIVAPGENYGRQFLLALQKAVLLTRWFDCRTLLTRSPIPPLNLAREYRQDDPIVMMVEGVPRNLNWLIPDPSMTRKEVATLTDKLTLLHQIVSHVGGEDLEATLLTLVTAATDDPLTIYYEIDRLIERRVATSSQPEQHAISLSGTIGPIATQLIHM